MRHMFYLEITIDKALHFYPCFDQESGKNNTMIIY